MFSSNSAWNWWNFVHNIMHECDNPLFYLRIVFQTSFLLVNCYNLSANLVSTFQKLTFVTFERRSDGFLTIIRNHAGWSLTGNRKQKNVSNFWPKKWSRSLWKLSSGRLRESFLNSVWLRNKSIICKVVAYGRWSLTRSGRYQRVDCIRWYFAYVKRERSMRGCG